MLVFAPQNLIEDPPFTKLDLLSCRNLLIYFDAKLQQRLMPMFHYALRRAASCFSARPRRSAASATCSNRSTRSGRSFAARTARRAPTSRDLPPAASIWPAASCRRARARRGAAPSPAIAQSAERALMQHLVPPASLMHERGEIVHIHGRTGQFLEPAPGSQTSANVYNMARDGLQLDLAVAVRHARGDRGGRASSRRAGQDQRPHDHASICGSSG